MRKGSSGVAVAVLALCLVGCASGPPKRREPPEPPKHPPTAMLLPYAAPDGTLTRAQMEAGLHRDFAKADVNHNGCLDDKEVRTINQQRWTQDASTASPLIDFKQNGCFDFDEYAATARSLFDQLDRERNFFCFKDYAFGCHVASPAMRPTGALLADPTLCPTI